MTSNTSRIWPASRSRPRRRKKLGTQLGSILGYIEKLGELDVSNVEPTAHAVPMVNVTRADEVRPSLPHDEAMRNAPAQANGLFMVPKIDEVTILRMVDAEFNAKTQRRKDAEHAAHLG